MWLTRDRAAGQDVRFGDEAAASLRRHDRRHGTRSRAPLAATIGRVEGPERGLVALDSIAQPGAQRFQPAWATRAHLLHEAGRLDEASQAYQKAISLTTERGVRRYLEARRTLARSWRARP